MSFLFSGMYTITSVATGAPVGRNWVEDRSLHPKGVVSLKPGGEIPRFKLEVQSDGAVIVKINDAHTVKLDDKLFAALTPEPPAEKWRITRPDGQENGIYIIETHEMDAGWILTGEEPETQVSVKPLIAIPTPPLRYPPNELWKIVRVVNK